MIMKDFHNVFAYYSRSEPKEIKCQKKYIFEISYDVMFKYIWTKNVCHNVLKNVNIFKKWLEWF
jgi:hypothetical protein